MGKDIVSKDILKRLAVDLARILFGLEVTDAEILETEYQRVEERRADLVARMGGGEDIFVLHVEVQNTNDAAMPWRMLRYRAEIGQANPESDIRQYLVYIGRAALAMSDGIQQSGLDYRYRVIDMHQVDCSGLLAEDNPDALVLAILCDFRGRQPREVIRYILERLRFLTAENENRYREYLRMLEILSTNRDLEKTVEEEEKMLSQVEYSKLPSYNIGHEKGLEEGRQEEARAILQRLIARRFGSPSADVQDRLQAASLPQLEAWAGKLLEVSSLEDLFAK